MVKEQNKISLNKANYNIKSSSEKIISNSPWQMHNFLPNKIDFSYSFTKNECQKLNQSPTNSSRREGTIFVSSTQSICNTFNNLSSDRKSDVNFHIINTSKSQSIKFMFSFEFRVTTFNRSSSFIFIFPSLSPSWNRAYKPIIKIFTNIESFTIGSFVTQRRKNTREFTKMRRASKFSSISLFIKAPISKFVTSETMENIFIIQIGRAISDRVSRMIFQWDKRSNISVINKETKSLVRIIAGITRRLIDRKRRVILFEVGKKIFKLGNISFVTRSDFDTYWKLGSNINNEMNFVTKERILFGFVTLGSRSIGINSCMFTFRFITTGAEFFTKLIGVSPNMSSINSSFNTFNGTVGNSLSNNIMKNIKEYIVTESFSEDGESRMRRSFEVVETTEETMAGIEFNSFSEFSVGINFTEVDKEQSFKHRNRVISVNTYIFRIERCSEVINKIPVDIIKDNFDRVIWFNFFRSFVDSERELFFREHHKYQPPFKGTNFFII